MIMDWWYEVIRLIKLLLIVLVVGVVRRWKQNVTIWWKKKYMDVQLAQIMLLVLKQTQRLISARCTASVCKFAVIFALLQEVYFILFHLNPHSLRRYHFSKFFYW